MKIKIEAQKETNLTDILKLNLPTWFYDTVYEVSFLRAEDISQK